MNKHDLYAAINKAFLPAKEIEIPQLFSGRKEELVRGIHALRSEGANLCIHGNRGVGKTSIAKQLRLVAAGCTMVTDIIGRPELFSADVFKLPAVYFNCDDTIKNTSDLFRKILVDRDSFNGICQYNNGIIMKRIKTKSTASAGLTSKILSASLSEEEEIEHVSADLDSVSAFKSVTSEIVDLAEVPSMLVVIDEFERMKDKTGIASIMRTCPAVKFLIVGVAKDINSLIKDHESVRRQFAEGILKIDPMDEKMLTEILKRAERILGDLKFKDEVLANIVASSYGYPHWVHLLGKLSCINAVEKESKEVDMTHFNDALETVVKSEPLYDEEYRDFACESREKELILKLLALDRSEVQNLSDLFSEATSFDIGGVSWWECINELVDNDIIELERRDFATFRDVRFKVYCSIRTPLYAANKKENIKKEKRSDFLISMPSWTFRNIEYSVKDIDQSYVTVSDYVPLAESWMGNSRNVVIDERKPSLYDHKGKPIY